MTHRVRNLKSREEAILAVGVAEAVGATAIENDVEGRQGVVDALLKYPDGRYAALEVTSHAGDGIRQRNSELTKRGSKLTSPGQWTWTALFRSVRYLPEFEKRASRLLLHCEAVGITDPSRLHSWEVEDGSDLAWLLTTDIKLSGHPQRSRPGEIFLLPASIWGFPDGFADALPDALHAVLDEPNQRAHVEKLARSGHVERHLCLLLLDGGLPSNIEVGLFGRIDALDVDPPRLPGGLTHLWFLSGYGGTLIGVTPTGWQLADVPSESVLRSTSDYFA